MIIVKKKRDDDSISIYFFVKIFMTELAFLMLNILDHGQKKIFVDIFTDGVIFYVKDMIQQNILLQFHYKMKQQMHVNRVFSRRFENKIIF
jgi:hypothetical protein